MSVERDTKAYNKVPTRKGKVSGDVKAIPIIERTLTIGRKIYWFVVEWNSCGRREPSSDSLLARELSPRCCWKSSNQLLNGVEESTDNKHSIEHSWLLVSTVDSVQESCVSEEPGKRPSSSQLNFELFQPFHTIDTCSNLTNDQPMSQTIATIICMTSHSEALLWSSSIIIRTE